MTSPFQGIILMKMPATLQRVAQIIIRKIARCCAFWEFMGKTSVSVIYNSSYPIVKKPQIQGPYSTNCFILREKLCIIIPIITR